MGPATVQRDRRRSTGRGTRVSTTGLVVGVLAIGAAFAGLVYTLDRLVDAVPDLDLNLDLGGRPSVETSYAPAAMRDAPPVWSAPGGTRLLSAPVVADGRVLVRALGGELLALDAATGARLWSADVGGAPLGTDFPPVVADGMVYVTGGGLFGSGGRPTSPTFSTAVPVFALDAATGAVRWTVPVTGAGGHPLRVVDGDVYVNADRLAAIDGASGAVRWSAPVGNPAAGGYSQPAVVDDVVAVGGGDGRVHAFDRATGAPRWATTVGAPVDLGAGPTVLATAQGFVVVSADRPVDVLFGDPVPGRVRVLDAERGTVRWEQPLDEVTPVGTVATVIADAVYVPSRRLTAFDLTTGEPRWESSVQVGNALAFTPLALANGSVYVPGADGRLHAVDAVSGADRGRIGTAPPDAAREQRATAVPPAFAGPVAYFASGDHAVYAYATIDLRCPPANGAGRACRTSVGP